MREALKEDAEPWVTAICEDKQRNIWIGTAKGIVRLSQVNVRPLKMVHGYEEKENIGARVVSALLTGTTELYMWVIKMDLESFLWAKIG